MDEHLRGLITIASEPILTPPHANELDVLKPIGYESSNFFEMLSEKNGWYAFESALHVFPLGNKEGVFDLKSWNSESLWRSDFKELTKDCFFFAEDIFGVQFCFKQGQIFTFDPETGQTELFAKDLSAWSNKILNDFNLYTGYPIARQWQKEHGPLKQGKRLLPKTLFSLGGAYTAKNLYELNCVEGMKFRASIAMQMRDIPSGTKVKLRVIR